MWGVNFFQLFLVTTLLYRDTVSELAYACAFSEEVKKCEDFENKFLDCDDLKLKGGEGLGLAGKMVLNADIEDGFDMCAEGWKMTEVGKEMVFSACGDICGNLDDQNTPWYPILEALNATFCPVPNKEYPVNDMKMSMDFAKDVLCHDFVGDYIIKLLVMKGLDKMSCHDLGFMIYEYETDE